MKPIQDALWSLARTSGFHDTYEQLRKQVLSNPEIISFVNQHGLDHETIRRNLVTLYEYETQSTQCQKHCPGLDKCPNVIQGYRPKLTWQFGQVQSVYETCKEQEMQMQQARMKKLVQSMHVPEEILYAKLGDLYIKSDSRIEVMEHIHRMMTAVDQKQNFKGLYLSGSFGIGKTFILGVIANTLAEKGLSSLLVYFPEFVREMKSAISDQTLEAKLKAVKSAPILMIDDIGAESISNFTRDEILGTILQYRMLEKLPTFFTSNFTLNELEAHLSINQRGDEENVKAKRIIERIRTLTVSIEMIGENLRR